MNFEFKRFKKIRTQNQSGHSRKETAYPQNDYSWT